ncbi:hypothetical protein KIPB_003760 [Kipferlia bialata]|uniref:DNA polymerase delta catalytic subunit n=1 Tax=Kipferlia bialata TaxID=797122 RepID=A0A9K3CTY2_9EUKA|nr:hypothetical protein KIPB_003760 [Kipferlia bialata]|eukprot:g3760.t1
MKRAPESGATPKAKRKQKAEASELSPKKVLGEKTASWVDEGEVGQFEQKNRPDVKPTDYPRGEKLEFMMVDIEEDLVNPQSQFCGDQGEFLRQAGTSKRVNVYTLYGVTEAGHSIAVHVHGFFPYLYVKQPSNYNDAISTADIRHHLQGNLPNDTTLMSVESVLRTPLYGYTPKEQRFLRLRVSNRKGVPALHQALSRPGSYVFEGAMAHGPLTYESNLDPVVRFLVDTRIVGCGWASMDAKQYIPTPPSRRTTRCQLEYDVNVGAIHGHPGDSEEYSKLAPLRVFSFDIECVTSEGFPDPARDPVIQIAFTCKCFGTNKELCRVVLCLDETSPLNNCELEWFKTEQELLRRFCQLFVELDPDVVTGYNTSGFDFNFVGTAHGLNKMMKGEIPRFENMMLSFKLSDFSTDVDLDITTVDFDISNLTFTNSHIGDIVVSTDHVTQEIELKLTDIDLAIQFDWSFKETTYPFLEDSGTGTATASSINGDVIVVPAYDDVCGVFAIDMTEFVFEVGHLHIHLDGGASALYNVIVNGLVKVLEDNFTAAIDTFLAQAFETGINQGFHDCGVDQWIGSGIRESMQFVDPGIVVLDSYLSVHLGGYAYPQVDGPYWEERHTADIMPGPLSDQVNDADLQYEVSNTVFESIYLSALSLDLLKGTVDPTKVTDPLSQTLLTTATLAPICPGLYEAYPDSMVRLDLVATEMPTVSVMPSATYTNVTGVVSVSVATDGAGHYSPAFEVGYSAGLAGTPMAYSQDLDTGDTRMTFHLAFSPYNTTSWQGSSQFGEVVLGTPHSMQLEMLLSIKGVAPWMSEWSKAHGPNISLAGDYYDWDSYYAVLKEPQTLVWCVPMV